RRCEASGTPARTTSPIRDKTRVVIDGQPTLSERSAFERGLDMSVLAMASAADQSGMDLEAPDRLYDIVGESAALKLALARLSQVAQTNSSVLLLGPTGTGKELFARALHERSRRHARP